jgi:small subunit ribosomal protein S7
MSRRKRKLERRTSLDPRYNDMLVAKFVNCLMRDGKKSTAEGIFYRAMDQLESRGGPPGLTVFRQAVNNAKPLLEVKSRRVGGATYQVPVEVRYERQLALAMRWLIQFSRARAEKTMADRLAGELLAASKSDGATIKKKEDVHRMAEANKAFAHYRW